jgi:hypothetical protein
VGLKGMRNLESGSAMMPVPAVVDQVRGGFATIGMQERARQPTRVENERRREVRRKRRIEGKSLWKLGLFIHFVLFWFEPHA